MMRFFLSILFIRVRQHEVAHQSLQVMVRGDKPAQCSDGCAVGIELIHAHAVRIIGFPKIGKMVVERINDLGRKPDQPFFP